MKALTITESKAQLSALVEKVVQTGRPVVIGRAGKPLVQLVPYSPASQGKRTGAFRGQIQMTEDYEEWTDEEAAALGLKD
jgi:prevent-host-death family protein